MRHLGDITQISGYEAPAVEVVIGGSPCQDLSVAGKREGLSGKRSGLFMEQIRIIKEMREHDKQNGATYIRPRYMVWENVPGAFSSNKGEDFRIVLEETARVVEPSASIPRPECKWTNSGAVMGDGWSIAWRVFDAQFWGVPQRRRRIALVADFGGATAPEILFERNGVSGNTETSGTQRKGTPEDTAEGSGNTDNSHAVVEYNRRVFCLRGNTQLVYDARGNGEGAIAPTITGDHETLAIGFPLGFRPENTRSYQEKASTIVNGTRPGHCNGVICIGNGQANSLKPIEKVGTLNCMHDQQAIVTLDRASFNQGQNALYDFEVSDSGINPTLVSKGPSAVEYQSLVRRLTPLECERLQGFPDGWTDIGDYIDTKGKKRTTSDTARYKALGNSIALPFWLWMLDRLGGYCTEHTMASLFDGIGGFPLIWETLNGKGSCLWASEIEEFPMAVTQYHFGEENQ